MAPRLHQIIEWELENPQRSPAMGFEAIPEMFAELDLNQLHGMARNNSNLEPLVLEYFVSTLQGQFEFPPHESWDDATEDCVRFFGPFTIGIDCSTPAIERSIQWHLFDVNNIETMSIHTSQLRELCEQNICFGQLDVLCLTQSDGASDLHGIKFDVCFPKLSTLECSWQDINNIQNPMHFPRNMECLTLDDSTHTYTYTPDQNNFMSMLRLSPCLEELHMTVNKLPMELNDLIEYLIQCGIHKSLRELSIDVGDRPIARDVYQLSHNIVMFQKMQRLRVGNEAISSVENLRILNQIPRLDLLLMHFTIFDESNTEENIEFLKDILANIPNTLRGFVVNTNNKEVSIAMIELMKLKQWRPIFFDVSCYSCIPFRKEL